VYHKLVQLYHHVEHTSNWNFENDADRLATDATSYRQATGEAAEVLRAGSQPIGSSESDRSLSPEDQRLVGGKGTDDRRTSLGATGVSGAVRHQAPLSDTTRHKNKVGMR
jgi:hypothetical protein